MTYLYTYVHLYTQGLPPKPLLQSTCDAQSRRFCSCKNNNRLPAFLPVINTAVTRCTNRQEQYSDSLSPVTRSPSLHTWFINSLKPLHTIGKVSANASILYNNQEMRNETNLWKFQLILLFLLRENSQYAFSIFVFILMAGVFVSFVLDLIPRIIRKR